MQNYRRIQKKILMHAWSMYDAPSVSKCCMPLRKKPFHQFLAKYPFSDSSFCGSRTLIKGQKFYRKYLNHLQPFRPVQKLIGIRCHFHLNPRSSFWLSILIQMMIAMKPHLNQILTRSLKGTGYQFSG